MSDNKISDFIKTTTGMKQGGYISPSLFNKYIDSLLILLEDSKLTYTMGNIVVGIIVYADDTNIICEDLSKLQKSCKR